MDKYEDKKVTDDTIEEILERFGISRKILSELLGYNKNTLSEITPIYNNYGIYDTYKPSKRIKEGINSIASDREAAINILENNINKITGENAKKKAKEGFQLERERLRFEEQIKVQLDKEKKLVEDYVSFINVILEYIKQVKEICTFKYKDYNISKDKKMIKLKITIDPIVRKKLEKIKNKYREYTLNQIINTILEEKIDQFLNNDVEDRVKEKEYISQYYLAFISINEIIIPNNIKQVTVKKHVENILEKYKMKKTHLAEILTGKKKAVSTLDRILKEETKDCKYYSVLEKMDSNPEKMFKLLEKRKSEGIIEYKIYKKYKDIICSERFILLEKIKNNLNQVEQDNMKMLEFINEFIKCDKSTERGVLQELIEERVLIVKEYGNNENFESFELELYPEVYEKLNKISSFHSNYSISNIVNTLLEKKLIQYVAFRK